MQEYLSEIMALDANQGAADRFSAAVPNQWLSPGVEA